MALTPLGAYGNIRGSDRYKGALCPPSLLEGGCKGSKVRYKATPAVMKA